MIQTNSSNIAQIEYWNTEAGETWAKFQEALDRQIETLGLAAMDTLKSEGGEHIIDIGCGCGQTSLDLGSRVGPRVRSLASIFPSLCLKWRCADCAWHPIYE
jgi:cyclopropane fatty-acyl-phospholipid synthase-like methyltransferase